MARNAKAKGGRSARARARAQGHLPRRIILHASAACPVEPDRLKATLSQIAPRLPPPEFYADLLAPAPESGSAVARAVGAIASFRIADPKIAREFAPASPADPEIEFLIDSLPSAVPDAVLAQRLYDGERVACAVFPLIPQKERGLDTLHIWATRRLLVTYSEDNLRYHARYAVFGYPTIFSVLGLSYAPAPSLQASLFAREAARAGMPAASIAAELDRVYPEEKIDIRHRATVSQALVSVALQAAAGLAEGKPFCLDPSCRLFNPHRKPEVVHSMLGGTLCAHHAQLLGATVRGKRS